MKKLAVVTGILVVVAVAVYLVVALTGNTDKTLDLTGSGVETIAHLTENGRLTVMFCAFEGRPRILRLYGRGTVIRPDDPAFDDLRAEFGSPAGLRSIIRLDIDLVGDSCGFAVPLMDFAGERETLGQWADRKGPDGLEEYWATRNTASIDGLPGLVAP